ncbi:MAG TPA: hypothetical protein VMR97_09660 [Acidimicrobiales bacterium]|nr:hypothetical protein [Acidimicrobiales bacterium]
MIAVDVLLGLNLLVVGVVVLRGQSERRERMWGAPVRAGFVYHHEHQAGDAVILPFRPSARSVDVRRAMSAHPSAQGAAPEHG